MDSEADHVTVKSSQNCAINRTRRGAPETNGAGPEQGSYRDLFSICNASSPAVIKYEDILCDMVLYQYVSVRGATFVKWKNTFIFLFKY